MIIFNELSKTDIRKALALGQIEQIKILLGHSLFLCQLVYWILCVLFYVLWICFMCIVGGQRPISIRMNNKDSIQKNTLQISEKISLFSLGKKKKESSGM